MRSTTRDTAGACHGYARTVRSGGRLVVGGGKGGKTLAMDLAKQGYRSSLIERDPEMIGGTCINVACIPTKALVQSAKVAAMVRRAGDYGIGAELTSIDMNAVREHKRAVVSFMRSGNYPKTG